MSNLPPKDAFFRRDVERHGDALQAAGIGLEGIGLMLSERDLSSDEVNALHHAVIALGAMVKGAGGDLYSAATAQEGNA
nr:hypothetical protein [Pseudomonas sp. UBA6718]